MWELCLDAGIGHIDAILYADFHGIEQVGSKRAILTHTWLVSRCMRGLRRVLPGRAIRSLPMTEWLWRLGIEPDEP